MNSIITIFDLSDGLGKSSADLFDSATELPLVCPHTHVDPNIFADPEFKFSNPAELFITPDHYVVRMLVSQGIPFEQLGIFLRG